MESTLAVRLHARAYSTEQHAVRNSDWVWRDIEAHLLIKISTFPILKMKKERRTKQKCDKAFNETRKAALCPSFKTTI